MQQAVYSRQKNLLFQVSYYEKRINFEVFHALTDGTGAMYFLQELVSNYLKKAHPEQDLPSLPVTDMSTPGDQEEDSFSQYYSSDIPENSEKNLVLSDFRENGCFMRICILQRLYFR